jgi:hypothetical protein
VSPLPEAPVFEYRLLGRLVEDDVNHQNMWHREQSRSTRLSNCMVKKEDSQTTHHPKNSLISHAKGALSF